MANKDLKLTFYGGAETVTGANFMLEGSKKILIDCGLYQGPKFCDDKSCLDFAYDSKEVEALLVTHAHADHIGRIPKLVHDGFLGTIYSTLETKEIAEIMLEDALKFVLEEARENQEEPLYNKEDIAKALTLWKIVPYHKELDLGGDFKAYFKDAGHILGSAIIEVSYHDKKIAFSGDLGNSPAPYLKDTEYVTDADYLVLESVYGDRNHEDRDTRKEKLKEVIEKIVERKGTLLIPAFSVSRTQTLLFELNDFIENGIIPEIPVFLDSPLAIKVTEIYRNRQNSLKDTAKDLISAGDKIFDFPNLTMTVSPKESRSINEVPGPKIIIAGSGMSNGGRILHHERKYLPDHKNILLFIGYQAPGSLGRIIQEGAKSVEINKEMVKVNAELVTITGYSGHKDSDGLLEFVEKASEGGKLKKVFVVMGEPRASMFLAQKIRDNLDVPAISPKEGDSFTI